MSKELKNLDYCNQTLRLKKDIEGSFVMLGEYLHTIKENQLYEPQWSSFEEFCFELKMSSNMVNKLMMIYKTFILGYGFTQEQIATAGGWSVIAEVLPQIDSKKSALKWLASCATLTRSDLRKELLEAKTGIPMKQCEHKDTYTVEICRNCGQSHEVFPSEQTKTIIAINQASALYNKK